MNYLFLSAIVIGFSYLYERLKSNGKTSSGVRWLFYIAICFSLCLFAGLRTRYNDTFVYIEGFSNTPSKFSIIFDKEFSIADVYLFEIWNYVIYHFISNNANVYLFLCSIVFICPAVYLIEKYTTNFTFSMIMFMFGGMYLFSLAGIKQSMATGVVLLGLRHLFNKKYFRFYFYCVIAIGFHAYSVFYLFVPLLGTEIFNKRTIIFSLMALVIGLAMSSFSGAITTFIEWLGKDIDEETLKTGSVNVVRAIIFFVPLALAFIGRKNLAVSTKEEKWFVKLAILSAIFMVLALFGNPIFFGRIPQYFLIGTVVTMPLLIEKCFAQSNRKLFLAIAVICYIIYGLYTLYMEGAFEKDIFALIWQL